MKADSGSDDDQDMEEGDQDDVDMDGQAVAVKQMKDDTPPQDMEDDDDPEDPLKSTPLTRYNAMLAIVKNTLYMLAAMYYDTWVW